MDGLLLLVSFDRFGDDGILVRSLISTDTWLACAIGQLLLGLNSKQKNESSK